MEDDNLARSSPVEESSLLTEHEDAVVITPMAGQRAPRHAALYLNAASATLGALALGVIIGYSSPASPQLQAANGTNCSLVADTPLTSAQVSWFSASVPLGALAGACVGGLLSSLWGRRAVMVGMGVPFVLGWALIGLAPNFPTLMAGRVVCGVCAGMITLVVPTYIAELSSADVRGFLGTCFQLAVTLGVLLAYAAGSVLCWQWLAALAGCQAAIFALAMAACKETPAHWVGRGRADRARAVLTYLRGPQYDIDSELESLENATSRTTSPRARDLLLPHNRAPLLICVMLMVFQQFCGINAMLFNLNALFQASSSPTSPLLSPSTSAITIAAIQVLATLLASVLMDRAGRKFLLLVSSLFMTIALIALGSYFRLLESHHDVSSLSWIPITSLVMFIIAFSVGFGPVPWLMMGEVFSPAVRGLASTVATLTNWSLAFAVTVSYGPLVEVLNMSGVYWLFAGFSALSFVFSLFVVKETKGKTPQEIAAMFGAPIHVD